MAAIIIKVVELGIDFFAKLFGIKLNNNNVRALPAPPVPSAPPEAQCRADDPPPKFRANDPPARYRAAPIQYQEPVFCGTCQRDRQSCHGCGDPIGVQQRKPEPRRYRDFSPPPPPSPLPLHYVQLRPRSRSPQSPRQHFNPAHRVPMHNPDEDEQMRLAIQRSLLESHPKIPRRRPNIQNPRENRHAPSNPDQSRRREQRERRKREEQEANDMAIARSLYEEEIASPQRADKSEQEILDRAVAESLARSYQSTHTGNTAVDGIGVRHRQRASNRTQVEISTRRGLCTICQEELPATQSRFNADAIVLPDCQCAFHNTCFQPWYREHGDCPNCRTPVN